MIRSLYKLVAVLVLIWAALSVLFVLYTANDQYLTLQSSLDQKSQILHRLVSQRVGQHDAHMTSLSALAVNGESPSPDVLLTVATAIGSFYPRIKAIDLVSLASGKPVLSSRASLDDRFSIDSLIKQSAEGSSGELVVVSSPLLPASYLLIKRSPNNAQARFGLALQIDIAGLLETDDPYWQRTGASRSLLSPNASSIFSSTVSTPTAAAILFAPIVYRKVLGSQTQPLELVTAWQPTRGEIYPLTRLLLGIALIGAALLGTTLLYRLLARTRRAERRAQLGEQDARIAHASRVNALGEMASGMAHELTQPLTAILSQSQAGLKILARQHKEPALIEQILKSNVEQSQRAGRILERLRDWSRVTPSARHDIDVNRCVANVVFLLDPIARRQGVLLTVEADASNSAVMGDSVALEQVVFNLIRNALDAHATATRRHPAIHVVTLASDDKVTITVTDNGPGVAAAMSDRLFEPFATGREGGMGLGLALCRRIVEGMDGEVTLADNADAKGASAVVVLPKSCQERSHS